jgi:phenylalanyl-tRNA synthetase beta chain
MAKELSAILNQPLKTDPFLVTLPAPHHREIINITISTDACDFYSAAVIKGVKVGPSPDWLKERLASMGQRSINNIVDATNFVMFELGQPLHAFDADKLSELDGSYQVGVRQAKADEKITTLTGEAYTLSVTDAVIIDGVTDEPIGIAGIKGGLVAAVDAHTTTLVIESAHFNRVSVRHTAQQLKLQTDASKRYENGIVAAVAPIALQQVTELICAVAGGQVVALQFVGDTTVKRKSIACSLAAINSLLGLNLTTNEVTDIFDRYLFSYTVSGTEFVITPPFERDDLLLAEDVIEEIGRLHGLHHIVSVLPEKAPLTELNARHYYAEKIRTALVSIGFSEVYTSSFRATDIVKLENALASDKGCLRSSLAKNLRETRTINVPHRDLLGISAVKIFEIGTVFLVDTEEFRVALAVQTGTTYKAKLDDPLVNEAVQVISDALGMSPVSLTQSDGVIEFSLDELLLKLPAVSAYDTVLSVPDVSYQIFSVYPAISRDVAMWVPEQTTPDNVSSVLRKAAGSLVVRLTHLDTFNKEGKTSMAFRLVFQAKDRTLTDTEIEGHMDGVYESILKAGWEAR